MTGEYVIKAKVYPDDPGEREGHFTNVGRFGTRRDADRALATLSDQFYNGWRNYETWAVNLWLTNDEGLYNESREIVRKGGDEYGNLQAQELADFVKGLVLGDDPGASLATDLLTHALGRVEWRDIVEGLRED